MKVFFVLRAASPSAPIYSIQFGGGNNQQLAQGIQPGIQQQQAQNPNFGTTTPTQYYRNRESRIDFISLKH
jgi:hypothetical protein